MISWKNIKGTGLRKIILGNSITGLLWSFFKNIIAGHLERSEKGIWHSLFGLKFTCKHLGLIDSAILFSHIYNRKHNLNGDIQVNHGKKEGKTWKKTLQYRTKHTNSYQIKNEQWILENVDVFVISHIYLSKNDHLPGKIKTISPSLLAINCRENAKIW